MTISGFVFIVIKSFIVLAVVPVDSARYLPISIPRPRPTCLHACLPACLPATHTEVPTYRVSKAPTDLDTYQVQPNIKVDYFKVGPSTDACSATRLASVGRAWWCGTISLAVVSFCSRGTGDLIAGYVERVGRTPASQLEIWSRRASVPRLVLLWAAGMIVSAAIGGSIVPDSAI